MTINIFNGEFHIDELIIYPKSTLGNLKDVILLNGGELRMSNKEWLTYRVNISDHIIVMRFFNEHIYLVEIVPDELDEIERHQQLQNVLERLGGQHDYSWGKIGLYFDPRSSSESVFITYGSVI